MTNRAQGGSGNARDKLAFLLSLVPYLIEKQRVSVAEVGSRFDVPNELVRESVELIAVSGVPGETHSYQHEDLFDIDWEAFENDDEIVLTNRVAIDETPRFSSREVAALLAGLQYLSALPRGADHSSLSSVMSKLACGATSSSSKLAVKRTTADRTLTDITTAVESHLQIEFDYLSARDVTEHRVVDPLRVDSVDTSWYLRGWCHLRDGIRTFRVDRMSSLIVTKRQIERFHQDVYVPDSLFTESARDLFVTLDIQADAIDLVRPFGVDPPTNVPQNGIVRVRLRVAQEQTVIRLVASGAGLISVVEPQGIRNAVLRTSKQALDLYQNTRNSS